MVTGLEEFYNNMSKGLRDHFCDSRLFPYMDLVREGAEGHKRFEHHKGKLGKRFKPDSEDYKIGLEYLTRLYGIKERGGR